MKTLIAYLLAFGGQRIKPLLITLLIAGSFACLVPKVYAQEDVTSNQLKAVLLYKLSRFVTWPAAVEPTSEPLTFCVAQHDDFGAYLDALSMQSFQQGASIKLTYLPDDMVGINTCHLAFASKSADKSFQQKLATLITHATLTVSDVPGFAKAGGMIEIIRRNHRLGFVINMAAVRQAGLRIAAPLLQMSTLLNLSEKKP